MTESSVREDLERRLQRAKRMADLLGPADQRTATQAHEQRADARHAAGGSAPPGVVGGGPARLEAASKERAGAAGRGVARRASGGLR